MLEITEKRCGDFLNDTDAQVQYAMVVANEKGMIHSGDPVVVVSTWKDGPGFTNTVRIVYADFDKDIQDCPIKKPRKSVGKV